MRGSTRATHLLILCFVGLSADLLQSSSRYTDILTEVGKLIGEYDQTLGIYKDPFVYASKPDETKLIYEAFEEKSPFKNSDNGHATTEDVLLQAKQVVITAHCALTSPNSSVEELQYNVWELKNIFKRLNRHLHRPGANDSTSSDRVSATRDSAENRNREPKENAPDGTGDYGPPHPNLGFERVYTKGTRAECSKQNPYCISAQEKEKYDKIRQKYNWLERAEEFIDVANLIENGTRGIEGLLQKLQQTILHSTKYPEFGDFYKPHIKQIPEGDSSNEIVIAEANIETPLFGQIVYSAIVRNTGYPFQTSFFTQQGTIGQGTDLNNEPRVLGPLLPDKYLIVRLRGATHIKLLVPSGYRPLQPFTNVATIHADGKGSYDLTLVNEGLQEVIVPLRLNEGLSLSSLEQDVFTRAIGFEISEWPESIQKEVLAVYGVDEDVKTIAQAVAHHLATCYKYSKQARTESDPIDAIRAGYLQCDMAAYAMVGILRDVYRIPCRAVVGFHAKKAKGATEAKSYVLLSEEGHAWVEVFHDDQWHAYDPTPSAGDKGGDISSVNDISQYEDQPLKAIYESQSYFTDNPFRTYLLKNSMAYTLRPFAMDQESVECRFFQCGSDSYYVPIENFPWYTHESRRGKLWFYSLPQESAFDGDFDVLPLDLVVAALDTLPNKPIFEKLQDIQSEILDKNIATAYTEIEKLANLFRLYEFLIDDATLRDLAKRAQEELRMALKTLEPVKDFSDRALVKDFKQLLPPVVWQAVQKAPLPGLHANSTVFDYDLNDRLIPWFFKTSFQLTRSTLVECPSSESSQGFSTSVTDKARGGGDFTQHDPRLKIRRMADALRKGVYDDVLLLGELYPGTDFLIPDTKDQDEQITLLEHDFLTGTKSLFDAYVQGNQEQGDDGDFSTAKDLSESTRPVGIKNWLRDGRTHASDMLPLQRFDEWNRALFTRPDLSISENIKQGYAYVPLKRQKLGCDNGDSLEGGPDRITIIGFDFSKLPIQTPYVSALASRALSDVMPNGAPRNQVVFVPITSLEFSDYYKYSIHEEKVYGSWNYDTACYSHINYLKCDRKKIAGIFHGNSFKDQMNVKKNSANDAHDQFVVLGDQDSVNLKESPINSIQELIDFMSYGNFYFGCKRNDVEIPTTVQSNQENSSLNLNHFFRKALHVIDKASARNPMLNSAQIVLVLGAVSGDVKEIADFVLSLLRTSDRFLKVKIQFTLVDFDEKDGKLNALKTELEQRNVKDVSYVKLSNEDLKTAYRKSQAIHLKNNHSEILNLIRDEASRNVFSEFSYAQMLKQLNTHSESLRKSKAIGLKNYDESYPIEKLKHIQFEASRYLSEVRQTLKRFSEKFESLTQPHYNKYPDVLKNYQVHASRTESNHGRVIKEQLYLFRHMIAQNIKDEKQVNFLLNNLMSQFENVGGLSLDQLSYYERAQLIYLLSKPLDAASYHRWDPNVWIYQSQLT